MKMKKRMIAFLLLGILCALAGLVLAVMGVKPGIVPAVMVAIGGGWIGVWAIWSISTKGGTVVRDEMVVRVETLSGNYAFLTTMWFIIAISVVNMFHSLPWSVSELLFAMILVMSLSNLMFRWILLKRGKVE